MTNSSWDLTLEVGIKPFALVKYRWSVLNQNLIHREIILKKKIIQV
jgi:hypothetical protein